MKERLSIYDGTIAEVKQLIVKEDLPDLTSEVTNTTTKFDGKSFY